MATAVNNHQRRTVLNGSPRLFSKLLASPQQHKMAELRAAYEKPSTSLEIPKAHAPIQQQSQKTSTEKIMPAVFKNGAQSNNNSCNISCSSTSSTSTSSTLRRKSANSMPPTPSLMDLAASAGLLALSPSDLVFESSMLGIAYYDYVLSVSEVPQAPAHNSRPATPKSVRQNSAPTKLLKSTTANGNDEKRKSSVVSQKRRIHAADSEPAPKTQQAAPNSNANLARKQTTAGSVEGAKTVGGLAEIMRKHTLTDTFVEHKNSKVGILLESTEHCSADQGTDSLMNSSTVSIGTANNNNTGIGTLYRLLLAKLDSQTNVEWFQSVVVPSDLLERNGIPVSELSLLTMGILVWRSELSGARLLCLATGAGKCAGGGSAPSEPMECNTAALEALKRAAGKYKCMHHVLTIGQRRHSAGSTHSASSCGSYRSTTASSNGSQASPTQAQQDKGMKLRVLMCQSRNELPEVPAQAVRDTKFLLTPSTNPLLCLCYPFT